jgi:hypothetical protein
MTIKSLNDVLKPISTAERRSMIINSIRVEPKKPSTMDLVNRFGASIYKAS